MVDDASTDGTADLAADFARADPRFRLIRQPQNRGGYAARNRALAEATGELVTVHDADDWSHPEKIARQVRPPRAQRRRLDLLRLGAHDPGPGLPRRRRGSIPTSMGLNDSSALFRRELFARFGAWDTARIGADKELIWRFERLAGRPRGELPPPAACCRAARSPSAGYAPGSLTRSARDPCAHRSTTASGASTARPRALWQDGLDPRPRCRATAGAPPPPFFPAPPVAARRAAPRRPRTTSSSSATSTSSAAPRSRRSHMIAAARAAGLTAALLHYRRYDQDVTAPARRRGAPRGRATPACASSPPARPLRAGDGHRDLSADLRRASWTASPRSRTTGWWWWSTRSPSATARAPTSPTTRLRVRANLAELLGRRGRLGADLRAGAGG